MTYRRTLLLVAAVLLAAAAVGSASAGRRDVGSGLVFVQTNQTSGNQIVVYRRTDSGVLLRLGTYATGGAGGIAAGSASDHLASQGSLLYDATHGVLIAVNAGSHSLSTFRVTGDRLERLNVVSSGGPFPASLAISGDVVYVLNAGERGSVVGFRLEWDGLHPLADSRRFLGLSNTNPPNFLTSPGQVGFTPDGHQLAVTTKASGSMIDVFAVGPDGLLSTSPTTNASATPVPFAFTFTPSGRLAVGEAVASSLSTYIVQSDGALAAPKSLSDGQMALCWIQRAGDFYYVSNTASNTISAFRVDREGQPSLVGDSGVVATTGPGPIDMTAPSAGGLLYVETGSGTVTGYHINAGGTLSTIATTHDLPPGIEGIAST